MTAKSKPPLTPDEALEQIRSAADSRPQARAAGSVPDALLDKAWQIAQSYQQRRAKHPSVGAVAANAESANDWSWVAIQVLSLAAETPKEAFSAMRRVPPKESAERWSLSRYPINGQKAVYLMFEAETDSIERYTGCRIQVLAEDKTYELGEVNDDGVAELRLEGTVDISRALVRIGTRRHRG